MFCTLSPFRVCLTLPTPHFDRSKREGSWPHDHHRRGKRCRVLTAAELKTTVEQPDFMFHCVSMPPCRIGSSWHQTDNRRAFPRCGIIGLFHPTSDVASVGRIHEHYLIRPSPAQIIFFACEMRLTLY